MLQAGAGVSLLGHAARDAAAQPRLVDVAIVGAGISGLVTAWELDRAGVSSIVVLEARDRVGGRTLNQEVGGGYVVEAGGQWIGPTQDAVLELARELGVGTFHTYDAGNTVYLVAGERAEVEPGPTISGHGSFVGKLDRMAETVPLDAPWAAERAAEWDRLTFGEWLDGQGIGVEDRFGIEIGSALTFGAPSAQLSLLWVLFYVHSAGGWTRLESIEGGAQQDRLVGGSQVLSLRLAERLGDRVRLATPVQRISGWQSEEGPVRIATGAGELTARRLVVAMMPASAAKLDFDPALPGPRRALQSAWPTHGTGAKVHMVYRRPFWRDRGLSGQVFSDSDPALWTVDNSPPDAGRGVLMSFVDMAALPGGESSRRAAMVDFYRRAFGDEAGEAIGYVELDWEKERFSDGCVSPLAPGVLTAHGSALRGTVGRVHFAGTETAEVWNGYMDGAVRAGRRVARDVRSSLGG